MTERRSRIVEQIGELRRPFQRADRDAARIDPVREAFAKGREEGLAEGRRESEEAFDREREEIGRRVGQSVKTLGDLQSQMIRDYKALMIELALEAASRIVRRRIEADDPIAARALEEALEALPAGSSVKVRVHPGDLESIRSELAREIEKSRVELEADEEISRGGCVVAGDSGTIDARLETAEAAVQVAAEGRPE